jgi:hypothetical protein
MVANAFDSGGGSAFATQKAFNRKGRKGRAKVAKRTWIALRRANPSFLCELCGFSLRPLRLKASTRTPTPKS